MAKPATDQTISYDDNPTAPQIFADGAFGFWLHNGVVTITMTAARINHSYPNGAMTRQVVARMVVPAVGAQQLAAGLYDFLKKHGLDPVPIPADTKIQ